MDPHDHYIVYVQYFCGCLQLSQMRLKAIIMYCISPCVCTLVETLETEVATIALVGQLGKKLSQQTRPLPFNPRHNRKDSASVPPLGLVTLEQRDLGLLL